MAGSVHLQLSRLRGHGADLPGVHRRRDPSAPRVASSGRGRCRPSQPFSWRSSRRSRGRSPIRIDSPSCSAVIACREAATPLERVSPASSAPDGLRMRIDLFWSFFSPSFLFISGDSSVINSTRADRLLPDRVRRAHTGWPRSDRPRARMAGVAGRRWRVFHRAGRRGALRRARDQPRVVRVAVWRAACHVRSRAAARHQQQTDCDGRPRRCSSRSRSSSRASIRTTWAGTGPAPVPGLAEICRPL